MSEPATNTEPEVMSSNNNEIQQNKGCMENEQFGDNYTFPILMECLRKYIDDLEFNDKINKKLSHKREEMKIFHLIYRKYC